jgi:hypothetical protein
MVKNEVAVVGSKMPVEKYKTKPTEELVESIIQDIEAMLVERIKTSRENMMLALWETGQLIRKCESENKINVSALVNRLALDNRLTGHQMGERNIWFALKVFDLFPKFEKLYDTEHGENITVSKLKKMLTTPKPKKEKSVKEMAIDAVERLGVETAREFAKEIIKECDKQEKK